MVNILYTTPTAVRGLMRYGGLARAPTCLRCVCSGSVSELINPGVALAPSRHRQVALSDPWNTWWQTETGGS